MPDRTDLSQPPAGYTAADDATQPGTEIVNSQLQNNPSGNAATGDELAAFAGPDLVPDLVDHMPGRTYTQYVDTTTEGGDYRPLPTVNGLVASSGVYLAGWNIIETTTGAAPFTVRLRDGLDIGAPVFATINQTNGSRWLMPGGIRTRFGLFVEIVAGSVEGNLYTRTVRAD